MEGGRVDVFLLFLAAIERPFKLPLTPHYDVRSELFRVHLDWKIMETFLGSITLIAFNFAPVGFQFCRGQTLPIAQNAALFSLLGPMYGGDGVTTFNLPNLTSPVAGLNFVIATEGIYPSRP